MLVELTSQVKVKPGTPPHRRPALLVEKMLLKKVALANFKSALLRLQILLAEAQQMHRYESLLHETGSLCGFQLFKQVFECKRSKKTPTNLEPGQCFNNCSHMSIGHVPPSIASSANKRSTQFLSGAVVRRKVGAKPQSIPSVFLLKSLK